MPPRGCKKAAKRASTEEPCVDDEDRISALPDAVLQHVLGFLPAQDAVRASVLGTRWSNLWRSTHRLRVALKPLWSAETQHMFVNRLLLLRDPRSAVEHCELDLRGCKLANTNYVEIWIRHALLLQARVLDVRYTTVLESRSLVSRFLKVLRLESVYFQSYILLDLSSCIALEDVEFSLVHFDIAVDFSSCRVLEDLQITSCDMDVCEIRSASARRLSLVNCTFGVAPWLDEYRAHICAPGLVCLEIRGCDGINPVLESMPLLQDASVWFNCSDEPGKSCSARCCGGKGYTFRKDLGFCPTFNKLRTLYLVNWCLTSDINALLRFLHHTPNLEKLTLELCEKEMCSQLEIEDCNPIEPRILLRQLNTVKVIYCISVHIYFMLRQHVTI
ncbi:hypothetical protein SORBI_3005G073101, partial [Sorghum bicolor]